MTKETVLQQCTVEGTTIKLPDAQLDRKLYMEVAKSLELIGGKWKGGKISGFVFPNDPTDLLSQIANGEKRNLKKEFQFFATPKELARKIVAIANPAPYDEILEPSAGQGAIVEAINAYCSPDIVYCFELMPLNQSFLTEIPNATIIGKDFLEECTRNFDQIIANPPFSKNQDIDHIRKMYECLKEGGRMASIASKHWQISSNKKETDFREWLNDVGAEIIDVEAGEFKESGTNIATCIIAINK